MKALKQKNSLKNMSQGSFVRLKGLEPPRLSAPDPKSGAATNYATTAFVLAAAKIRNYFSGTNFLLLLQFNLKTICKVQQHD